MSFVSPLSVPSFYIGLTWHRYIVLSVDFASHTRLFNGRWSAYTHPDHQTSFINFLHLLRFTTIYIILYVQFTCLTVLFDNLFPGPLWSSSWPWTLNFILHASSPNHHLFAARPYQRSLFCCNTNAMSSIPGLSQLLTRESIF